MNSQRNGKERLSVYVIGDYRAEAADGLAEFNYQNAQLLKNEFDFHFIEWRPNQKENYLETELKDGIYIHSFGTKYAPKFHLSKVFRSWINKLPKENVVFHLHHIFNLRNFQLSKVLRRAKLPYLITPHDSFVYGNAWNKKRSIAKKIYRKLFIQYIDKYVLENASIIHGLTEQCSVSLKHLTSSTIEIVPNLVKDTPIMAMPHQLKPQICFVGRFNISGKGIDLALLAFHQFKLTGKHPDVIFKLVGPASSKQNRMRTRICNDLKLKIGRDIIFTGKLTEGERNDVIKESMVYMQLSRNEGFGLSIVQALSHHKPVIISSQIPINGEIKKHKAGFVVNSPQEAAEALERIFSMPPEEYLLMAENARKCYEQEFHPSVIKPKLIELYVKAARKHFNLL